MYQYDFVVGTIKQCIIKQGGWRGGAAGGGALWCALGTAASQKHIAAKSLCKSCTHMRVLAMGDAIRSAKLRFQRFHPCCSVLFQEKVEL